MKRFTAAGWALLVLLVCLLAREAQCGVSIDLGGSEGWTNQADFNYTEWLDNYQVKVGDTMRKSHDRLNFFAVYSVRLLPSAGFNNYDDIDHSVIGVDKLGSCFREQADQPNLHSTWLYVRGKALYASAMNHYPTAGVRVILHAPGSGLILCLLLLTEYVSIFRGLLCPV